MTTRLSPKFALVWLFLLVGVCSHGTDLPGYAKSLEAEGDWYRAIGIWKELRFDGLSHGVFSWEAEQAILADLWAAKQDEAGLREVTRIEDSFGSEPVARKQAGLAWKGLFLYRLNRFPSAEYSWSLAQTPLYLGLLYAKTGRANDAKEQWKALGALPDPTKAGFEPKSPLIASGLSLLFPGAGQVYAGHWYDGAQAMTLVGFFGFSTYGLYLYDSKVSGNYALTAISGGITLFFELANIYGAYKTAEFFNQNQEAKRDGILEAAVFAQPLPSLDDK